jgi:hypothetical protein
LDIVVRRSWGVSGVVGWPLLLLLLLLWSHLLVVTPAMRLELISVLAECVIERARVWQSSPGSDEFDHLPSFCDVDGFLFVLIVGHREWASDNFV